MKHAVGAASLPHIQGEIERQFASSHLTVGQSESVELIVSTPSRIVGVQEYADLERVHIPRQRSYETRATFRNLCLAGDAMRDAVNRITHPRPSEASDCYDRENVQWPLICRAVLCIDELAAELSARGEVELAQDLLAQGSRVLVAARRS